MVPEKKDKMISVCYLFMISLVYQLALFPEEPQNIKRK